MAAQNGDEQIVQLLLEKEKPSVDLPDQVLLLIVSFSFSFFFFRFFIFLFFYLKGGRTPLFIAACKGHKQIVQLLLEKGKANVDLANKVIVLFVIILNLLILFFQSLQWKWREGGWILSDTCFVFYFFLKLFFFEIFFVKFGFTPLHRAAEEGFEQIVKILIEHHANVNLQNQVFSFFFFFFDIFFFSFLFHFYFVFFCYLGFGEYLF